MSDEDGRSPEFRRGRPRSGTEADAAGACGEVETRVIALYRGRQRVRQLVVAVQVVELEIVDKQCADHADRRRERRASFLPRSTGTGAAKALFGAKTGSLSRNLVPGRLGRNRKRASSSTRERDRVRCSRVAAGCRARGSLQWFAATEGSVRLDGQPLAASGTGEASTAAQSAVLRGAFGAGQEEGRSFSARAGLHAKRTARGKSAYGSGGRGRVPVRR